jgi:leucyl/phenylalanyl-tRNA--protein transferase
VIRGCADRGAEGTWITADMIRAYETLHHLGYAHSVEVWHADELAGGLYGVAIGGFFAGESMFTRRRDASKVALVNTVAHLRDRGFQLFDIQMVTDHTIRMGASLLSRKQYLARLRRALARPATFA